MAALGLIDPDAAINLAANRSALERNPFGADRIGGTTYPPGVTWTYCEMLQQTTTMDIYLFILDDDLTSNGGGTEDLNSPNNSDRLDMPGYLTSKGTHTSTTARSSWFPQTDPCFEFFSGDDWTEYRYGASKPTGNFDDPMLEADQPVLVHEEDDAELIQVFDFPDTCGSETVSATLKWWGYRGPGS